MSTASIGAVLPERILERAAASDGGEGVRRYFRGLARLRIGEDEDGALDVVAPNEFMAGWLGRRYGAHLRAAAAQETGRDEVTLRFHVDPHAFSNSGDDDAVTALSSRPGGNAAGDADATPPASPPAPPRAALVNGATHRRRPGRQRNLLRLDEFVVGAANELAHRAALALIREDGPAGFGHLFVHGECGVGKTHLLQGIAERFGRDEPQARVLYTTGEAFTNAFVNAVRSNTVETFRRKHRRLDLLCIDDVHFLSNKDATQREFLHTFNSVGMDGAKVLLASDEPPSRIRQFSKELVSRFSSGMVVRLERPDREMRLAILGRLAERRGVPLSDGGANLLADRCDGSARELEGALARVEAVQRLESPGQEATALIDAAFVERALGEADAVRPRRPVRVDHIVDHVSEAMGVEVSEVMGQSRHRRVVLARSMAAYLCRDLTNLSFPEIARAMGRPNHSSVVTAHRRMEKAIEGREPCEGGAGREPTDHAALATRLWRGIVREVNQGMAKRR